MSVNLKRTLAIAMHSLLIAGLLHGQSTNEAFPGPVEDAQLLYHPFSKSMLLIGGTPVIQDSVRSDVWKLEGNRWKMLEGRGPGSRVFFQGDVDRKTGKIVMFAGTGLGRNEYHMTDLWSYGTREWSLVFKDQLGSHDHHKMVYADHLDAFVLYGGKRNNEFDTTTWLFRDGKFTAMKIPGPGIRYQSAMAYDKRRKKVVLYGGGEKPGEHWEFDGSRWERITPQTNPGIKLYHQMVYDEASGAVILHGGRINHDPWDPVNLESPRTWRWDGASWKEIARDPVFAMAIGYDPVRKAVIAYGYDKGDGRVSRNICLWKLGQAGWKKLADYGEWNTLTYLEEHLRKHPADAMALLVYANELKAANRMAEAEAAFRKIEPQRMPQKTSVWYGLINVLLAQKKAAEAEGYISRMELSGYGNAAYLSAVSYYNLACFYAGEAEPDKAFSLLHKAAALGYDRRKNFEGDKDLEPLRSDGRWAQLLEKLKQD